jgi:hypothetical protein
MTDFIRRIPRLAYALAVLFFAWAVANGFWELSLTQTYGDPNNPMILYAKSNILFRAALDSTFLVTSGVMIEVLIRIFDRLGVKTQEKAE